MLVDANTQRVKSAAVRMREILATLDPAVAYRKLLAEREERDRPKATPLALGERLERSQISPAKMPMLQAILQVIDELKPYWPLTVRQVHYRLLNIPPLRHWKKPNSIYQNNRASYQDLCGVTVRARLSGVLPWEAITDETRPVSCTRFHLDAGAFMDTEFFWLLKGYRRDLQQSQKDHIELVAEKLTVQSTILPVANQFCVPLTIGRGFCSLSPRYEIAQRFRRSGKDRLVLILVSDLDPDGECIAESFGRSMRDDFDIEPRCVKALLTMDDVKRWKVANNGLEAKQTSSRYAAYKQKYGTDKVYELEAINPSLIQQTIRECLESEMDIAAFNAEIAKEQADAAKLQAVREEIIEFAEGIEIDED